MTDDTDLSQAIDALRQYHGAALVRVLREMERRLPRPEPAPGTPMMDAHFSDPSLDLAVAAAEQRGRAAEREECAELVEGWPYIDNPIIHRELAAAIRARGGQAKGAE